MELPPRHIDAFLRLLFPEHATSSAMADALRRAPTLVWWRVLLEADRVTAATGVAPATPVAWALYPPASTRALVAEEVRALVVEALDVARAHGATEVATRLDASAPAAVVAGLVAAGLHVTSERVEVASDLTTALEDATSPLRWEPASAGTARRLLARAMRGDPDGEGDDPADVLDAYLDERDHRSVLHVGHLDDLPVALVLGQVHAATGTGRLALLGVVPEARGRGLGGWTHRHGLHLLRAHGATRYRGGTHAKNASMLRIFERNGCARIGRTVDLQWTAPTR